MYHEIHNNIFRFEFINLLETIEYIRRLMRVHNVSVYFIVLLMHAHLIRNELWRDKKITF